MSDEELAAWCEAQACRSQREGWDETMRAIAAALRRPPAAPPPAPLDGAALSEASHSFKGCIERDCLPGCSPTPGHYRCVRWERHMVRVLGDQTKGIGSAPRTSAASPSPPAPAGGWRPIDFMAVKQCSECSSQLCATAHGMTGIIVVFDSQEAAEAYQRAMLDEAATALGGHMSEERIEAAAKALVRNCGDDPDQMIAGHPLWHKMREPAALALAAADRVSLAGTGVGKLAERLHVVAQHLTAIDEPHYAVPVNEAAAALAGLAGENARLREALDRLVDDVANGWGDPHTLKEARAALQEPPDAT